MRAEQKVQLMLTLNWEEKTENILKAQARKERTERDKGAIEEVHARPTLGSQCGVKTKTGKDSRDTHQGPRA